MITTQMLLIALGALLIGGLLAGVFLSRAQKGKVLSIEEQLTAAKTELEQYQRQLQDKQQQELQLHSELGQLRQQAARIPELQQESQQWRDQWQNTNTELGELKAQLQSQQARFEQENKAAQEKLQLLQDSETRLQQQFENLANKIFEQKTEKFSESSAAGLNALLTPLKEQIDGFKKQVTDQYVKEGQERASLKTEILSLKELNQQITAEAAALTKALKGDNKQQGNWGEVVLERILKESGLREGHEFETQVNLKNETGKTYQPDVVVHLPNDKDVVIDAKVSLGAYERYFNAEDDAERQRHLNEHVQSLRNHIKALGSKDYQDLQGVRSLDYVLMFVPIEPAFLLAVEQAPELVKLALDNNIMLVSPTNLLVALRTINNIWQYEYQNQNAQDIAKKAGALYDKFHGFVTDMQGIGTSLGTLQKRYDEAMKKLSSGRGNLLKRSEEFRQLGVQTNKRLDTQLLDKDDD